MTSYFSSLLTTTTSRVASIRQNLLSSEADGDTEDDTHLCRVLRAYYTEKGRPFPGWLPPDPKAPPPIAVAPVYSQNSVGRGYGGMNSGGPMASGGSLSSLWDNNPQPSPTEPGSLRAGRGVRGGARAAQNPFSRAGSSQGNLEQVTARPLPSQRAGSYQTASVPGSQAAPGQMSASEKLRSRFKSGSRSNSPASMTSPRMADLVQAATVRQGSYNSSSSGGGDYEDRFLPGGNGGGYGGNEKPFVAATSPWASNESEFSGGGGGDGRRQGLPSGPGAGRRMGLPSGPRGQR